jgi:hypothetical protein
MRGFEVVEEDWAKARGANRQRTAIYFMMAAVRKRRRKERVTEMIFRLTLSRFPATAL